MNPQIKTCFKCKVSKSIGYFFKSNLTVDGRHSWCKDCCKEGNKRSREKLNSTIEGRAKIFLQNARKSAFKRQQAFELNVSDIAKCWEQQQGICAYSGRPMTLESGRLETVSIERIDSAIGYTPENTILVCQAINRMKSDFGFDDFYNLCRDVASFLGDDELKLAVGDYK
jgi:hypothetical protein